MAQLKAGYDCGGLSLQRPVRIESFNMVLRTSRLLLRELSLGDVPSLHEIEGDPSVTRYLPFDPRSLDQTEAYIREALGDQAREPRLNYDMAILRQDAGMDGYHSGAMIGRCGLGIRRPEHREAMMWYVIHPMHWRRGYAVEAASAMLDFAFESLGLHRVWADCDPRNTASCRVAARLGMTFEGHLRENYFLKNEWCDTAIYAILQREWQARTDRG